MRKWQIVMVLILSLALTATTACNPFGDGEEEPAEQMVEVIRGNLTIIVSGSGNLEASNEAKQTFAISGRIEKISVEEGDEVSKGEVLVMLETDALELALAEAKVGQSQAEVSQSQAKMSQTQAQAAHTQAETSRVQAQVAYSQAQSARAQALLAADLAEENLEDAEKLLDRIKKYYNKGHSKVEDAETALERVRLQHESAQAQLDAANSQLEVVQAQFKASEIQFIIAEDQLETANLQHDASQVQLESARLAIAQVQRQLDKATMTASIDGMIAKVAAGEGDTISPAVTIVHIIDPSSMWLTVQVDEIDIVDVKVGQKAVIEVDGLPDLLLEGTVSIISLLPTMEGGVILYDVEIEFEVPEGADFRVGMSATADILIANREGVLLVPSRAIRQDSKGNLLVEIVADGETELRQVVTGLSDGFETEIVEGLEGGEVIIERRTRAGSSGAGFLGPLGE